jgi:hypothetical protein
MKSIYRPSLKDGARRLSYNSAHLPCGESSFKDSATPRTVVFWKWKMQLVTAHMALAATFLFLHTYVGSANLFILAYYFYL